MREPQSHCFSWGFWLSRFLLLTKSGIRNGGKPCICTNHECCMSEVLHDLLLQRFQRCLLVGVAAVDTEGKRDPISVHEQTHLHDGIRTVFLARSILPQPAFLLNFKVVVGAVVVVFLKSECKGTAFF